MRTVFDLPKDVPEGKIFFPTAIYDRLGDYRKGGLVTGDTIVYIQLCYLYYEQLKQQPVQVDIKEVAERFNLDWNPVLSLQRLQSVGLITVLDDLTMDTLSTSIVFHDPVEAADQFAGMPEPDFPYEDEEERKVFEEFGDEVDEEIIVIMGDAREPDE